MKTNRNHSPKSTYTAGNVPKRSANMPIEEGKSALEKPVFKLPLDRLVKTPSIIWHNRHRGKSLNTGIVIHYAKLTICQKIN